MTRSKGPSRRHLPKSLGILHEDEDIIVVDKPAGLLTMDTGKGLTRTVYYFLTDYIRKGNSKSRKRICIVHRLDRDASGILVFAKNDAAKFRLQDQWQQVTKTYLAVVQGKLKEPSGTIKSYLTENRAFIVYSTQDTSKGKLSVTDYTVLKEGASRSILEIKILTGRKHQIRVHLAESGHAIVGDKKYGKKTKGNTRMALHAFSLKFRHPTTGEVMTFETKKPEFFWRLVGGPVS